MTPPDPSPLARGRLLAEAGERPVAWHVPEETPVAVLVNGEAFAVMMATPADLEDFGVGFAITEGLAAAAADIRDLRLADAADGIALNLKLDPARVAAAEDRRRTLAGRTGCGVCGARTIAAALPRPARVRGPAPSAEALRRAYAELPAAQPMKRLNRSVHAAAFCGPDGAVDLVREDVGRHNALDKLAGALAREGRDARGGFVLLSSRVSVEMVQKAAAIGAPFLAAVSAPTALALRTAARAGMGIAGLSRDGIAVFDADAPAEEGEGHAA